MADFVDQIMEAMGGAAMDDSGDMDEAVSGLEAVGELTPVGAAKLRRNLAVHKEKIKRALQRHMPGMPPPSPPFAQSSRDTERRAPLGFIEDGTGANFFTVAAGATSTMRAKVSRVTHVNRLLIVPSAPGIVLQSVKVGDEEQLLASGAPVELYSTLALTDSIPDNFSPLAPGLDFIIILLNTTGAPITGTIGTKASCKR